jgi:HEAT repeats
MVFVAICPLSIILWSRHELNSRLESSEERISRKAFHELHLAVRAGLTRNIRPYLSPVCKKIRTGGSEEDIVGILQNSPREDGRNCLQAILERIKKNADSAPVQRGFVAVLGHLGSTSDNEVVNVLEDLLRHDPTAAIRLEAATAITLLAGEHNERIAVALQHGLASADHEVSAVSAFALWSKAKTPKALDALIGFLDDADHRVRKSAAGAFAQIETAPTEEGKRSLAKIMGALTRRLRVEQNSEVKFWIEEAIRVNSK